jgi:hypothetical protein
MLLKIDLKNVFILNSFVRRKNLLNAGSEEITILIRFERGRNLTGMLSHVFLPIITQFIFVLSKVSVVTFLLEKVNVL